MTRWPALPLLFLSLAVVACSGEGSASSDTGTPTATSTVVESRSPVIGDTPSPIPGAFFGTPSGAAGRLVEGTRCWANMCVDMIGPITPASPVNVAPGEPLDIQVEGVQPSELGHSWMSVDYVEPKQTADGQLAWVGVPGDHTPGAGITAPLAAGDYVLSLFAQWDGTGDISFATYVRVP